MAALRPTYITDDVKTRFWAKVDVRGSDQCWEWQAGTSPDGYGRFGIKGEARLAHRVSWVMANQRDLPSRRMVIMHSCDNPACVNPAHLSLGTDRDNFDDMVSKGRRVGAPKGSANPRSKLTEDQVRAIRSSRAQGKQLAAIYHVSEGLIGHIRTRRVWKHVA